MQTLDANRLALGYELNSELARVGLHATESDPDRKLAWVNSICIFFLLIGIVGSTPAAIRIKPLPPIEEVSAAIVEPLPPPPQVQSDQKNQEQQNDRTAGHAPGGGGDARDSDHQLLRPNHRQRAGAQCDREGPAGSSLKPAAPVRNLPAVLNTTGNAGERPQPPYPKIALEQGQQGSVLLRMTVDDAGLVQTIKVAQSSGFPVLDHSALEFVKRHWTVPPGSGTRIYEATINYKLQID